MIAILLFDRIIIVHAKVLNMDFEIRTSLEQFYFKRCIDFYKTGMPGGRL